MVTGLTTVLCIRMPYPYRVFTHRLLRRMTTPVIATRVTVIVTAITPTNKIGTERAATLGSWIDSGDAEGSLKSRDRGRY